MNSALKDRNLLLSSILSLSYSSGSPVASLKWKACSALPTSHTSSTAGSLKKLMVTPGPISPLQSPFFEPSLLQSHPCCPAPYWKCQRISIWLLVTKLTLRGQTLYDCSAKGPDLNMWCTDIFYLRLCRCWRRKHSSSALITQMQPGCELAPLLLLLFSTTHSPSSTIIPTKHLASQCHGNLEQRVQTI